jgi:hypothetical protein
MQKNWTVMLMLRNTGSNPGEVGLKVHKAISTAMEL